jgi:hypothetical protein
MADYARVLACVDRVLVTQGLDRFVDKQGAVAEEALTDDVFISAVYTTLNGITFEGTSAELLTGVTPPTRSGARRKAGRRRPAR